MRGIGAGAPSQTADLAVSGGYYADGSYPDIDVLFQQQATERDRQQRETLPYCITRFDRKGLAWICLELASPVLSCLSARYRSAHSAKSVVDSTTPPR